MSYEPEENPLCHLPDGWLDALEIAIYSKKEKEAYNEGYNKSIDDILKIDSDEEIVYYKNPNYKKKHRKAFKKGYKNALYDVIIMVSEKVNNQPIHKDSILMLKK